MKEIQERLFALQDPAYRDFTAPLLPNVARETIIGVRTPALRRLASTGRPAAWGISLTLTFCAMQFCYKPADSFYWFNGGIYYTFFFALSYVLLGLLTLAVKGESNKARALAAIPLAPLAFLIGGGNYSTALSLAVLLMIPLLLRSIEREPPDGPDAR